jgi:hypothetical protein
MSGDAQQRALDKVLHAAHLEQVGVKRYRQKQRQASRVKAFETAEAAGAHPRRFDAKGFPVAQPPSTLLQRAARRINPLT